MEQPLQCAEVSEPTRKRRRKRRRRCKRHPKDGPHSPNCRMKNSAYSTNGQNLVRVLPSLKPVLDFLDVHEEIFTREQIMEHLTEYIKQKSLFDPADPRKVYCQHDQLGQIFKCDQFSTANACELLLQNLQTVNSSSVNREVSSSRQNAFSSTSGYSSSNRFNTFSTTDTCSCSESDQPSTNESCTSRYLPTSSNPVCIERAGIKRSRDDSYTETSRATSQLPEPSASLGATSKHGNHSTVLSESELSLDEYARYYNHVCENVTDVVTDTSDDLFFLNETDEERVVAPDRDEDRLIEEYEPISFSEEEQLRDQGRWTEDEEENESFETEVDEGEDGGDELGNGETDSEIEEDDKWECDSCTERNHPMTRRCRRCWKLRKDWYPPALSRSTSDPVPFLRNDNNQGVEAHLSDSASATHTITAAGVGSLDDKCIICQKEPRNGCIIHGQTGHQVCCVACARKLKEEQKPCPVCRKKIRSVITNFL